MLSEQFLYRASLSVLYTTDGDQSSEDEGQRTVARLTVMRS